MLFYLIVIFISIYLFIVLKRAQKYKYDTSKDYLYELKTTEQEKIKINNSSINISNKYKQHDTLFLKIDLAFYPISYLLKPFIEIEGQKHYFEYGAQGVRYINLSHIKDQNIRLKQSNLSLKNDDATLYGYTNNIDLSKKILILAPHADDAEIAAFGLYKSAKDVTIVTTTIGEHGVCNYCDIYDDKREASLKKAELRTFDALNVPLLGGVEQANSLTLGYYGGSLKWMQEHPNENAVSLVKEFGDMNPFRKVSHSHLQLPEHAEPNHASFLNDLEMTLLQIKPDYIITPHPAIDSHPDHKYTTYALISALKKTGLTCKLLTYTNHLSLSETYPVGPMHAAVTLPPNLSEFYFDGLYSFKLDTGLQEDKFFALEAIHDLRDSLVSISMRKAYKQLHRMLKRAVSGKDKRYFKRAVRANELFFVVESENIDRL